MFKPNMLFTLKPLISTHNVMSHLCSYRGVYILSVILWMLVLNSLPLMYWQFVLITPLICLTISCGIQPTCCCYCDNGSVVFSLLIVVTMAMRVLHNSCNMCTQASGIHIYQANPSSQCYTHCIILCALSLYKLLWAMDHVCKNCTLKSIPNMYYL